MYPAKTQLFKLPALGWGPELPSVDAIVHRMVEKAEQHWNMDCGLKSTRQDATCTSFSREDYFNY